MAAIVALRWIEQECGAAITSPPAPDGDTPADGASELPLAAPISLSTPSSGLSEGDRVRVCGDVEWLRDCFAARGLPCGEEGDTRLERAGSEAVVLRVVRTVAGWRLLRLGFENGAGGLDEDWFPEDSAAPLERPLTDAELSERCALELDETRRRLSREDEEVERRADFIRFCPSAAPSIEALLELRASMQRRVDGLAATSDDCMYAEMARTMASSFDDSVAEHLEALRKQPAAAVSDAADCDRPLRSKTVLRVGPDPTFSLDEQVFDDEVLPVIVRHVPTASELESRGLRQGMRVLCVDGHRCSSTAEAADAIRSGGTIDVCGQWEADVSASDVAFGADASGATVLVQRAGAALPRGVRVVAVDGVALDPLAARSVADERRRVRLRVTDQQFKPPDCVDWTAAAAAWSGSHIGLPRMWTEWVVPTLSAAFFATRYPDAALPPRLALEDVSLWLPDADPDEVAEAVECAEAALGPLLEWEESVPFSLLHDALSGAYAALFGITPDLAAVWSAGQPSPAAQLPCDEEQWLPTGFGFGGAPVVLRDPFAALCSLVPALCCGEPAPAPAEVSVMVGGHRECVSLLEVARAKGIRVAAFASALVEHCAARLRAGLSQLLRVSYGAEWCSSSRLCSGVHSTRLLLLRAEFERATRYCATAEVSAAAAADDSADLHGTCLAE
eukprot:TRINITY_DN24697_c0_g1_i1.p1 TRINITY_DN24697_c0_g1~~TRINITY_DN24697_c0_g1_i1.p1  ORF type:complete len:676 (+),score=150.06 TRINITY_DN24697_c0_g1_i1:48-2075(+)